MNLRHNIPQSMLMTCPICGAARDPQQAHAIPNWYFFECSASYTYESFVAHKENDYQLYHPCGRMLETIENLCERIMEYRLQVERQ